MLSQMYLELTIVWNVILALSTIVGGSFLVSTVVGVVVVVVVVVAVVGSAIQLPLHPFLSTCPWKKNWNKNKMNYFDQSSWISLFLCELYFLFSRADSLAMLDRHTSHHSNTEFSKATMGPDSAWIGGCLVYQCCLEASGNQIWAPHCWYINASGELRLSVHKQCNPNQKGWKNFLFPVVFGSAILGFLA